MCFGYEGNISFVLIYKSLKFHLEVGESIAVPEDYTQVGGYWVVRFV